MTVSGGKGAGLTFDIIPIVPLSLPESAYSQAHCIDRRVQMSVYSMTGYASIQHSTANSSSEHEAAGTPANHLELEIRSVNSRFLDLSFRLPEELRQFEPALRELIIDKLKRGKVEVRAAIETGLQSAVLDPTPQLMQRLNAMQERVKAWLPGAGPLSVADVIRLAASEQAPQCDWRESLLPLTAQALTALLSARQREGERLATLLLQKVSQLRLLADQAVPLVPQLAAQQRQRFMERWRCCAA